MSDIYDRIDYLLKEKGWSRRQLAIKAGIKPGTLSAAFARRNKKISSEMLQSISTTLGVNPNYILTGETVEERAERWKNELGPARIVNPDDPSKNKLPPKQREELLLTNYNQLNDEGQEIAIDRVSALIPKYPKGEV